MNQSLIAFGIGLSVLIGIAHSQDQDRDGRKANMQRSIRELQEKLRAAPRPDIVEAEARFLAMIPELPSDKWTLQTASDAIASAWSVFNGGNFDASIECSADLECRENDNTQYVGAFITSRLCWRVSLLNIAVGPAMQQYDGSVKTSDHRDLEIWLEPTSGRLLKIRVTKPGVTESRFRELNRLDATTHISKIDREVWLSLPEKPNMDFCRAIANGGGTKADEIIAVYVRRSTFTSGEGDAWSIERRTIPPEAPEGELREPQRCWRSIAGMKGGWTSNGPGPLPAPESEEKPLSWYMPRPMDIGPGKPIDMSELRKLP